jgi:quinoprotein glucose dehydrogenase
MWRPISGTRSRYEAAAALQVNLGAVLSGPNAVRIKGTQVATQLGLPEAALALKNLFADKNQTAQTRANAVIGLGTLRAAEADAVVAEALQDASSLVRAAGRQVLALLRPEEGIVELARAVQSEEAVERQSALAVLAQMTQPSADAAIASTLEMLLRGQIAADTQLDVLEAATTRPSPEISRLLAEYQAGLRQDDHLAGFREVLFGGDATRGERIFFERTDVSCVRCHKVGNRGGEVGPDLSQVAKDKQREYLLEALVDPNRVVAKGFESVVLVDAAGRVHIGVLKGEDDQSIRIITAEAKLLTIAKADIDERQPGKSAMPDDVVKKLSKRDLRDLVEYLSNRQ